MSNISNFERNMGIFKTLTILYNLSQLCIDIGITFVNLNIFYTYLAINYSFVIIAIILYSILFVKIRNKILKLMPRTVGERILKNIKWFSMVPILAVVSFVLIIPLNLVWHNLNNFEKY